jgi:peptidylprolyl isomerase
MSNKRVVKVGDGVIVHFKGKFEDGSVFNSKKDGGPLEYTVGRKMVLGGLDKGVVGMHIGQKKKIIMEPEDAFGLRKEDKIKEFPKSKIPKGEELKIGMILQTMDEDGNVETGKILEIKDDSLIVDYNHPMAGKSLTLHIELIDIV